MTRFMISKKLNYKKNFILTLISFSISYSAQASNICDELDKLGDSAKAFFSQNIVEPFTDKADDLEKHVERAIRPKSSNYLDRTLQNLSDNLEDTKNKTKRKVIRPAKRKFKKFTKKLN